MESQALPKNVRSAAQEVIGGFATRAAYRAALRLLSDCSEACKQCADASFRLDLGEDRVNRIRHCLECADACHACRDLLWRRVGVQEPLLAQQLDACAMACQRCWAECVLHESNEQCRNCARACQLCEQLCRTFPHQI